MDTLAPLPQQPEGLAFPTDEWPTAQPSNEARVDALSAETLGDPERFGETLALLSVHRGRLVFERYGEGHGADETYRSWSMAKSFVHAWVGILIRDRKLSLEGPAPVQRWEPGDPRFEITLENLLRMQDGLDFVEDFDPERGTDVIRMLFRSGKEDVAAFAENRPLAYPPGTHWNYSSGTTNIVAALAGRCVGAGRADTQKYLERELLHPLGIRSAILRFDAARTFIGSSYLFASARDFARFALLYLRDGVWEGRRILPEGWVDHARRTTPGSGGEYGAHWWLRGFVAAFD